MLLVGLQVKLKIGLIYLAFIMYVLEVSVWVLKGLLSVKSLLSHFGFLHLVQEYLSE